MREWCGFVCASVCVCAMVIKPLRSKVLEPTHCFYILDICISAVVIIVFGIAQQWALIAPFTKYYSGSVRATPIIPYMIMPALLSVVVCIALRSYSKS